MSGNERGMEYLWIGRAIGMVQSMRFSIWFREVLKRSLYVLPFLAGPIFLILTTMHVFVYIGKSIASHQCIVACDGDACYPGSIVWLADRVVYEALKAA